MKLSLTLKHTFIKTLKLSDIKKMKSFKTSCSATVNCNLKLTLLMLFKKHFNEDVFKNEIKKTKITLDEIKKVSETISVEEEI